MSKKFNEFVGFFAVSLMVVFSVIAVINGINIIIEIRPLIGSLSFSGIIHGAQFSRLVNLDVLSHSVEPIAVQIIIIKLFAALINEVALLSVVVGLFAIKKASEYLSVRNAKKVLDAAGAAAK